MKKSQNGKTYENLLQTRYNKYSSTFSKNSQQITANRCYSSSINSIRLLKIAYSFQLFSNLNVLLTGYSTDNELK